jgi:hypothetical protein
MCKDNQLNRRVFLKMTSVVAATAAAGVLPVGNVAYGAALTKEQRDKLTPDEIIKLMKDGNQRFRLGKESPHDYLAQQKASAKGQYPAAMILSCIDSRAPAETIMDLGIGDTFQRARGWQCRQRGYPREYGIRVQGGRCKGRTGDGSHGLWRHQGRDRQRTARKPHRAARQDTSCRERNRV